MAYAQASTLRMAFTCHAQPLILFRPCILLSRPIFTNNLHRHQIPTKSSSAQRHITTIIPSIPVRYASSSTITTSDPPETLTWNEFLRLRRVRRRYNLGASVFSTAASLSTGLTILQGQNLEHLAQQFFGLDPFLVMGIWTLAFGAVGWLLGPLVGTGLFKIIHRKTGRQMAKKERDFFERIRKYRVDPTSSSIQNPVPDYYGEKITSVAGYRRWLKDQRAFNRKRQSFV